MDIADCIRIPLHGKYGKGKFALVDGDYDGEYFSEFKWYLTPGGYVVRRAYEFDRHKSYVYLHQEVSRAPKGYVTDHINRDKLDNRSINLRWATYKENAANRPLPTPTERYRERSKYRGVIYFQNRLTDNRLSDLKYQAFFRKKYLGQYDSPEDAARAYDKAAFEALKGRAILNFVSQ